MIGTNTATQVGLGTERRRSHLEEAMRTIRAVVASAGRAPGRGNGRDPMAPTRDLARDHANAERLARDAWLAPMRLSRLA